MCLLHGGRLCFKCLCGIWKKCQIYGVFALECSLWRGFVIKDSLGIRPGQNVLSVLERCSIQRMSALGRFDCSSKEITSRTVKKFNVKYVPEIFIERELRSLNRDKSTGIHDLNISLLKDVALVIAARLLFVINLLLRTGIVRSNWKMAQVTSLYKKGDKTETSDYKPTSILPTLSKILVRPLHYRLVNYFELSNLLSEI